MTTKADISKVAARLAKRMLPPSLRAEARELIRHLTISEFKQDNFTVVTLVGSYGKGNASTVMGVGVSKRMPTDNQDDAIGYNLALIRAISSYIQKYFLTV